MAVACGVPRRGIGPLRGLSFWEKAAPMSPFEDPPTYSQNQAKEKNRSCQRRARRPRRRICLLKGCTRTFLPDHPLERYCGDGCRERARQWREWKARHRYRQSDESKKKRRAQSHRYRLRVKSKKCEKSAAASVARVITTNFFLVLLRPPRVLRAVSAQPAFAAAAVLFPRVSPGTGACSRPGEALARAAARPAMKPATYRPDILRDSIHSR